MKLSQEAINKTTNAIGVVVGVPEIIQAIPLLIAGDFITGGVLLVKGIALLAGFYLIGK